MKYRVLLRLLGIISLVIGATMVFPLAASVYFHRGGGDFAAIAESMLVVGLVGAALYFSGRPAKGSITRREGLAIVGLGWLLVAALGAVPFYFSGIVDSYVDAYFESMSGFTTTGSTVLDDIDQLVQTKRGIFFWRSMIQWLGGMGIVVLFVAIMPHLKAGGKQLFINEVPGPTADTLSPRIQDTALKLWQFYLGFTVVLTLLLCLEGMGFYEAVCHSFSTMSTGGFSPKGASIGAYHTSPGGIRSLLIEVTLIVFMVLAATNFGIFYRMFKGDRWALFKDAEWRFFVAVLVCAVALVVLDLLLNGQRAFGDALRVASFQTVSLTTTTGFGTADFDFWPSFSKSLMVFLFFFGGCAGSTGGGMKIVRLMVVIKNAWHATERAIRPQTVRAMRVGKTVVEDATKQTILAYFSIIIGTTVIGTLALAAMGMDPVSAMTAASTCINNIGPGLETVGASESFSQVAAPGKVLLSVLMVVGRLEVFAILVLMSPRLWRSN